MNIFVAITHTFQTVADDHGECSQNRSYIVPLAGDLLQRYNKMDKALCVDITFYKAYKMKILSKSFANDTDTQQYLGYTDQIINVLRLIQVRNT